MRYRVTHTTSYRYAEPVASCHNELRLTPRTTPAQLAHRTQLLVEPPPATLTTHRDFFGNTVTCCSLHEPHAALEITAMSDVELPDPPPALPAASPPWEEVHEQLRTARTDPTLEAYQFAFASPMVQIDDAVRAWAAPFFSPGRPLLDAVRELTTHIHAGWAYAPATTTVGTPVAEILRTQKGVCQDFAHLEIAALRAMGLAARYVSGYLETLPPPGQERLVGADASHAWLAVYLPDLGWIDVDPTNGMLPCPTHVTVAWGRDYTDVAPVKGVILGGGTHAAEVRVDVQRVG